jgi:serine phosphatase RsbU (regulator of sigma subunit)/GAF domain-containing protein
VRRGRSLLLSDLTRSPYQELQVWLNDDVKSELAVPIEAGGELIGVMCFESATVNAFQPHHVRSAWYPANRAAIFHQLRAHRTMTGALLDLCAKATRSPQGERVAGHEALQELALLAKENLKASFSDISSFDPDSGTFKSWAASYDAFEPKLRGDGWTHFCHRRKQPLWLSRIESAERFTVQCWDDGRWIELTRDESTPGTVNTASVRQGVRCELGIPITIRGECVGVAWVKYKRNRLEPPQPGLMTPALGFAAHAALVVESIHRQEIDLEERKAIDGVGQTLAAGSKKRWDQPPSTMLDLHVICHPYHSRQGGDLHARRVIDSRSEGVLVIDGQGHGTRGLLHMLPLFSAFEAHWNSYSPAHVLTQMRTMARSIGVVGDALYFVVTSTIDSVNHAKRTKHWLIVSAAGTVQMLLFQKEQHFWNVRPLPQDRGLGLGYELDAPQLDQRVEVQPGDVIVVYSDGVADPSELFRIENCVKRLLNHGTPTPREIAEAIHVEARSQPISDDVTIVAARVKQQS